MMFSGFGKDALSFFEELERNNERAWFQQRKDVYERSIRAPMEALITELEPAFGPGTKIFRINRDMRFSKDKSPYKTYIGATVGSCYISLSPDGGLSAASGGYMLDRDALTRYRECVAADATGRQLEKIAAALERKGYQLGAHETLKQPPRLYDRDHARARFLKQKGIYTWKALGDGAWLQTRQTLERVRKVLVDARPLNDWLEKNVTRR